MSAVFIFEIKDSRKDKIFNFLKRCFSVVGAAIDMLLGVFSEIYMRLLKSKLFNFFQDIAKVILIYMSKIA